MVRSKRSPLRGFLFGLLLAGGCASPLLRDLGEGRQAVRPSADAKLVGLADATGKELGKPRFREIGAFHEGRARVLDRSGELYGFIDLSGRIVCTGYRDATAFRGGVAWVRPPSGLWQPIDQDGRPLASPVRASAVSWEPALRGTRVSLPDRTAVYRGAREIFEDAVRLTTPPAWRLRRAGGAWELHLDPAPGAPDQLVWKDSVFDPATVWWYVRQDGPWFPLGSKERYDALVPYPAPLGLLGVRRGESWGLLARGGAVLAPATAPSESALFDALYAGLMRRFDAALGRAVAAVKPWEYHGSMWTGGHTVKRYLTLQTIDTRDLEGALFDLIVFLELAPPAWRNGWARNDNLHDIVGRLFSELERVLHNSGFVDFPAQLYAEVIAERIGLNHPARIAWLTRAVDKQGKVFLSKTETTVTYCEKLRRYEVTHYIDRYRKSAALLAQIRDAFLLARDQDVSKAVCTALYELSSECLPLVGTTYADVLRDATRGLSRRCRLEVYASNLWGVLDADGRDVALAAVESSEDRSALRRTWQRITKRYIAGRRFERTMESAGLHGLTLVRTVGVPHLGGRPDAKLYVAKNAKKQRVYVDEQGQSYGADALGALCRRAYDEALEDPHDVSHWATLRGLAHLVRAERISVAPVVAATGLLADALFFPRPRAARQQVERQARDLLGAVRRTRGAAARGGDLPFAEGLLALVTALGRDPGQRGGIASDYQDAWGRFQRATTREPARFAQAVNQAWRAYNKRGGTYDPPLLEVSAGRSVKEVLSDWDNDPKGMSAYLSKQHDHYALYKRYKNSSPGFAQRQLDWADKR